MAASSPLPDSRRPSAISERRSTTASTARPNRLSSSSTESCGMLFRSGSGSPAAWTKTGPTATPSEAPTPVSLALSPNSVFILRDELREGIHGLLGVLPLRADDYPLALDHHDLRREPLRRLDELRRWSAVDPLFGPDRRLPFRHELLLSHRT